MLEFRPMNAADLPAVFEIRTAVVENAVTMARLEELGVTPVSLAAALKTHSKGWVCTDNNTVIGFTMGNAETGEVSVLATRPGNEGRGIGKRLMQLVQAWLFETGHDEIWLVTEPNTGFRAYGFYQALGWQPTGEMIGGDEKLILGRR